MTAGASVIASRGRGLAALTPTGRTRVPIAWALYDFANTIFSFAIVSVAMGQWLVADARFGEQGQVWLSIAVAASVGLNALVSPILGALSDRGGRRLPFLAFFTLLCITPTAIIGGSPPIAGVVLFVVANFAYQAALIYYDATLKSVSYPETRGKLSGIGVAIGYCGTIFIGLVIIVAGVPVDGRFPLVAALYGLFAIPLFVVLREPTRQSEVGISIREAASAVQQLRTTVRHAAEVPGLLRFLVGRFFYSDAVNTIIVVMGVVITEALGRPETDVTPILLGLTVVAIIASFGWGAVVDRLGPKRTLMVILASWAAGLVLGAVSLGIAGGLGFGLFLLAGAILGSGLGGVQVADRVLMVRLSPPERLGEFFGLYGLVGKGSQVIGQLLYAAILFLLLDSLGIVAYQVAVISLLVTMLIGAWLLRGVSDRWEGSGELSVVAPPERMAPMSAPIEPR